MEPSTEQSTSTLDSRVPKKPTGLIAGMIVCAVLAVGGIAFGIYGMVRSGNQSSEISDLKVQIANRDGTISALEADQVEISDANQTITIVDSGLSQQNPVIYSTGDLTYTINYTSMAFPTPTGERSVLYLTIQDGEVVQCSLDSVNCEITGLSAPVYKVVEVKKGQAFDPDETIAVAFLLENGNVEYISLNDAALNSDFSIKGAIDTGGFVTDILPVGVYDGIGGHGSTIFVLSDGTFVEYDESML